MKKRHLMSEYGDALATLFAQNAPLIETLGEEERISFCEDIESLVRPASAAGMRGEELYAHVNALLGWKET